MMLTAPLFGMTLHIDASMLDAPAVMVDPGVVLAVEVSTDTMMSRCRERISPMTGRMR